MFSRTSKHKEKKAHQEEESTVSSCERESIDNSQKNLIPIKCSGVYICQILHLKDIYLKLDTLDKSYAFGAVVMGVHLNEGVSGSNLKFHNIFFY